MATEQELEDLADKVSALFEGLDLDEVADVLKMQLLMLVTQGADDAEDAVAFLGEIAEDVKEMVEQYPFDEAEASGDDAETAKA